MKPISNKRKKHLKLKRKLLIIDILNHIKQLKFTSKRVHESVVMSTYTAKQLGIDIDDGGENATNN